MKAQGLRLVSNSPHLEKVSVAPERLVGLDAIRFFCAVLVVVSHFGIPYPDFLGPTAKLIWGWLFKVNGAAAVIVFFVISGLCIHFPHWTSRERFDWKNFFIRRYVRLVVPLLGYFALTYAFRSFLTPVGYEITWSLYAELIFYTLYPLIRAARLKWGWPRIIVGAWVASLALAFGSAPSSHYYLQNPFGTAVIGLPIWMLGCFLAENLDGPRLRISSLGVWRAVVWGLSVFCMVLNFHTAVHYRICLNFFGVVAAYWLLLELKRARESKVLAKLDSWTRWSYSLYLVHGTAIAIPASLGLQTGNARLAIQYAVAFVASWLFFNAIERPSHALARRIRLGAKSKGT